MPKEVKSLDPVRSLIMHLVDRDDHDLKGLSLAIKRNSSYLHQFINRRSPRKLAEEDRIELAKILGVDEDQLRSKKSLESDAAEAELPTPSTPLPPSEVTRSDAPFLRRSDMHDDVPVRGVAVGGDDGYFTMNGQEVDYIRRPPGISGSVNAFAIYVHSESMVPAYEPGTPVYINPARPYRSANMAAQEAMRRHACSDLSVGGQIVLLPAAAVAENTATPWRAKPTRSGQLSQQSSK